VQLEHADDAFSPCVGNVAASLGQRALANASYASHQALSHPFTLDVGERFVNGIENLIEIEGHAV
jgi:hypothetical protein